MYQVMETSLYTWETNHTKNNMSAQRTKLLHCALSNIAVTGVHTETIFFTQNRKQTPRRGSTLTHALPCSQSISNKTHTIFTYHIPTKKNTLSTHPTPHTTLIHPITLSSATWSSVSPLSNTFVVPISFVPTNWPFSVYH